MVNEFIQKTSLTKDMVFLDMGSGIGNVVLQVAGQTLCDCYGIEIMENPSILAKNQLSEFQTI